MTFLDLTKNRFSVRKYLSKEVEQEKLDYIFESVRNAASACNKQPWRFFVVRGGDTLEKLQKAYDRDWFKTAPMCIVACGNHNESWHRADGKDSCDIDVAIAVTHLTLAAAEQGLGTCWICNFDTQKCISALSLPENMEPIALIPIGYADVQPTEKMRKGKDEIFFDV